MTPADLEAIEARAMAATREPWKRQPSLSLDACVESLADESPMVPAVCFEIHGMNARADGEFIAHAREDIPALLAAHRALLARIAGLEAEVERVTGDRGEYMLALGHAETRAVRMKAERDAALSGEDTALRHQVSQRALVVEAHAERDAAREELERTYASLEAAHGDLADREAEARGLREQMGEARGHLRTSLGRFPRGDYPGGDLPGTLVYDSRHAVEQALAALSREPTVAPHVDVREDPPHNHFGEVFMPATCPACAALGKDGPR